MFIKRSASMILTMLLTILFSSIPLMAGASNNAAIKLNGNIVLQKDSNGNNTGVIFSNGDVMTSAPKDGKSVLSGNGSPVTNNVIGNIGDFYIDTANKVLYGPYNGSWSTSVSLGGASLTALQETQKSICDLYSVQSNLFSPNVQPLPLPAFCPPGDCVVSAWGNWSNCSAVCMGGLQTRTRSVVMPAYKGGAVCPALEESQACNTQACPTGKLMFVSSQKYSANLGGLIGADAKCQGLAANAGLTGVFKAWLSDNTQSAAQRLSHSIEPYVRTDGQPIANGWTGLTSGGVLNPINCDESRSCGILDYVWTNTDSLGNSGLASPCNSWTADVNPGGAIAGSTEFQVQFWTNKGASSIGLCNGLNVNRLYCIEQ